MAATLTWRASMPRPGRVRKPWDALLYGSTPVAGAAGVLAPRSWVQVVPSSLLKTVMEGSITSLRVSWVLPTRTVSIRRRVPKSKSMFTVRSCAQPTHSCPSFAAQPALPSTPSVSLVKAGSSTATAS